MKSSLFVLLGSIAGLTFAQSEADCQASASAVPVCGQSCIISAASSVGCTVSTDLACQCQSANNAAINSAAAGCVIGACGLDTALLVLSSASAACACESSVEATATAALLLDRDLHPGVAAPRAALVTPAPEIKKARGMKRQDACAASASAIPACGQQCLLDAGSSCGCTEGDYACQCSSSSCVSSSALPCVVSSCGIDTGLQVASSANALCACETSIGAVEALPTPAAMPRRREPAPVPNPDEVPTVFVTVVREDTILDEAAIAARAAVTVAATCTSIAEAIPSCGQTCLISAASVAGCTNSLDFACQCTPASFSTISSLAFNCILNGCGLATGLSVSADAASLCACVTSSPAAAAAIEARATPEVKVRAPRHVGFGWE